MQKVQQYRSYVSSAYAYSVLANTNSLESFDSKVGVVAGEADTLRQLSSRSFHLLGGNTIRCKIFAPRVFADLRYKFFMRSRKAEWEEQGRRGSTMPLSNLSKQDAYRLSESQFIKSIKNLRKFDDTGGG